MSKIKLECLVTSMPTRRENKIYPRLRAYINDNLKACPEIVRMPTSTEPFNTVEEFGKECERGALKVWEKHFQTAHPIFSCEEYGTWRAVHDYLGHWAWYKATNCRQGEFSLKGEIDALWAVANDSRDVLVVEGIIIETIARNLVTTPTFYPQANIATQEMAHQYIANSAKMIEARYRDIKDKPQINHHKSI